MSLLLFRYYVMSPPYLLLNLSIRPILEDPGAAGTMRYFRAKVYCIVPDSSPWVSEDEFAPIPPQILLGFFINSSLPVIFFCKLGGS